MVVRLILRESASEMPCKQTGAALSGDESLFGHVVLHCYTFANK